MNRAELKVSFAGPLVTVQDGGRTKRLRYGVPPSGPMDRVAHAAANLAVGNPADASCIEVSLGGVLLECRSGAVTFAVAGGVFNVSCGTAALEGWQVHTIEAGEKLTIRAGAAGSWCYLAFAGELQAPSWLGSAATHFLSGLGGGALKTGDVFEIASAALRPERVGPIEQPAIEIGPLCVVIGPQENHFEKGQADAFLGASFRVSDAFDRMGARLDGPRLVLKDALSIPSEPILRGSVQVSGDGVPTVLLADHQTTGGYPKIATLLNHETDRLAQMRSGDALSFSALGPAEAVGAHRKSQESLQAYFAKLAAPKLGLSETLMQSNLIGGVVSAKGN